MKNYTLNKTVCIVFFLFFAIFFCCNSLFADDIEAVLDSNDGSSSFAVQDSDSAEVMHVDSDGNIITNGNVGIGVAVPTTALSIDSHAGDDTAIVTIANTGGDFQIFIYNGSPENNVNASKGDLCVDRDNGDVYIKSTDAPLTTGWNRVASGIETAANVFLSNLTNGSVAINADLIADATSTRSLGSATNAWASLYADTITSQNLTNLTLDSSTDILDIDDGTIDLSNQTVDFTLNNAADSLNFDSDTLSINALNNRVGIGIAAPLSALHVGTGGVPGSIDGSNDVYIQDDLEVDGTIFGNISGDISGGYNPGFDPGSVVFTAADGSITENNSEFYWDLTNGRLSVGDNTTPAPGKLTVNVAAGENITGIRLDADDVDDIAVDIDSSQTTGDVVNMSAASLTTANVLDIPDANALTTGKILNLVSNSADASSRTLVQVTNDNSSADNATVLGLQQDGAELVLDINASDNNDVVNVTASNTAFTNDILVLDTNEEDTGAFNFLKLTADLDGSPDDKLIIDQSGGITADGNIILDKTTQPSIILTPNGNNTDFWLGVIDDADVTDDDLFEIGDGATPGTNPFFSISTIGEVGIIGPSDTDAVLKLDADSGDDAGDRWRLKSLTATNNLSFVSDANEIMSLTTAGNLQIDGDLTVSGDDLYMATNTAGYILVGDGTNFNPVPMGKDCSIAANGEVTCVASGGGISYDLVEDPGDNSDFTFDEYTNIWTASSTAAAGDVDFFTIDYTQVNNGTNNDDNDVLKLDLTTESAYGNDTLDGLVVQNNNDATNAAHVTGIRINNDDTTSGSMPDGIVITSTAADAITDAIDASDAEITNAINIGTNNILSDGTQISSAELNLLDGMSKSGLDTDFITGTAGGNNECAQFNADGDIISTGAGCGGTTAYDDIVDPDTDTTLDFANYANTWAVDTIGSDFFTIDQTGDATGGDLVTFKAGDVDITSLLRLENDEAVTMPTGLLIEATNAGGAITDAIDVSDAEIENAIDIGANNIATATTAISSTELELLDGMSKVATYDATFITGTPGAENDCAQFDADGNLVSSGAGCGGFPLYNDIDDPNANSQITFGEYTNEWIMTQTNNSSNAFTINFNQTPDGGLVADDADVMRMDIISTGDAIDTLDGLVIQYEDSGSNTVMDSAIKINNTEDTASTMTDGILITSTVADGIVDAIDVSDAEITNAINIGANNIVTAGATIASTELDLLDGLTGTSGDLSGANTFLVTGEQGASECAQFDANGNLIGTGSGCGGATLYDGIQDPGGPSTIDFADNTNTWTVDTIGSDFFTIDQTGDATGGDLVTFKAGDVDITSLLRLENDEAVTMPTGLLIEATNAGGAITDAIDVSDAEIENAINIGANNIVTSLTTIASTELDVLDTMTGRIGNSTTFMTGSLGAEDECAVFDADGNLIGTTCGGLYNEIRDPDGDGSINFAAYVNTWETTSADTLNFFNINATQLNDGADGDDMDVMRLNIASTSDPLSTDTLDGLVITYANGGSDSVMDSAIKIDNLEDAAATMTDGIIITSNIDGGITDAIDVSDAEITNAINIGTNNIVTGGGTIESTELDLLDGLTDISGDLSGVNTFLVTGEKGNDECAYFDAAGNLTGTGSGCGGNPSLDDAYNFGNTITADSGAVEITVPNDVGTFGLTILQNDITQDPAALYIANAGAGNDIYLLNTDSDATGAKINFEHASASPATGDVIGKLTFNGYDSGANSTTYSRISAIIYDTTDTEEDGEINFEVMNDGTLQDALRIDEDANVGIGTSNPSNTLRQSEKLAVSATADYAGMAISTFSATASEGGLIDINKSANATIDTHTVVSDGENIGAVVFRGSDGTNFEDAASIGGIVDGTPGDNDMPGSLYFSTTPEDTNALVERMRIGPSGNVGIGETTIGAYKLEIDTDDGDNVIGLNIDQDDVTNNNIALQVENAGTGTSLNIETAATDSDIIAITTGSLTSGNVFDINLSADSISDNTALFNIDGAAIDTATNVKIAEISTTAANDVDITIASIDKDAGTDPTIKYDEGDDQWQLNQPVEVDNSIVYNSEVDNGSCGAGGSVTIDWGDGNKQKITLTGNCTINFTAPLGIGNFLLKVVNGGAGTITWGASPFWPSGTAPSWTAVGTDIASFYYDGSDYYGVGSLDFR